MSAFASMTAGDLIRPSLKLITVMKRAEKKLDPVLAAFHDRVLFLKHNLNARAIASFRDERAKVEADIGALITDMNRSINEADASIKEMSSVEKT